MPGIFGYVKDSAGKIGQLESMADAMYLYEHFVQENLFEDEIVAASRVHLGHIGEKKSPYQNGDVRLWIEGEAYNIAEMIDTLELTQKGFAATLVEAYQKGILDKYLNRLDGYFCAALYDTRQKTLKLISDRYGMRMLYWYCKDGIFAWSSEVKGILELDGINKTIDATSPQCFMDLGYLMGEHTWFEHIKLINPATIVEFDIANQKLDQYHYWEWSQITPSDLTFEQAVDELGERFVKAVKRRFDPNERIGVSLSGGLDSRAILAAVDHLYPDYDGYSYTFGKPGCDDIKIAEEVVAQANWKHDKFYFTDENWFAPRLEKIWNTDGMMDMMHMHGSEFLEEISQNIDVNLNGYAGDVVMGGGFLAKIPLDTRVLEENAKVFYKQYSALSIPDSDFYDIKHVEPNIYMNRVRRFTNMGTVNSLVKINQRKPFFDNDIIELVFSLPDEYRLKNKIYSSMLRKYFPKYFTDIPWQKTGKPVGTTSKATIASRAFNKGIRIIKGFCKIESTKGYTNYPEWIRKTNVSSQLKDILLTPKSHTSKIFEIDIGQRYLRSHLVGKKDYSNQILRLATMEVYFRKVFQQYEE